MDYAKLGLKAGLEIHQQLDTNKLFCNCPSYLKKDPADFKIKRKLHKIAGETGEIDLAVDYEYSLNKEFIYEGHKDTSCLIELDESPPNQINQESLTEALKIALLMNCEIYQVSQIMRKTVIDGSNTSGFQRTARIAHNGFIETTFGKVDIESISLEEDSARTISETEKSKTYNLDRLGIPLVEITTAPNLSNPDQIKEAALKIGELLRACKVKRGIGTIRQDLNISIKGHDRVEVKGFQDPRMMIETINNEIKRQLEDIKNKKTNGEVRGALPDGTTKFNRPMPSQARMYPETDLPLLRISLQQINLIKSQLPKLKQEIRSELQKKGLNDELISLVLSSSQLLDEFETLLKIHPQNAPLVAKMVALWPNELATKLKVPIEKIHSVIPESSLEKLLEALNENKISRSDIKAIMEKLSQGSSLESVLKIEKISSDDLESEVSRLIQFKPGLSPNAYMGIIMSQFKGKIDGKRAMQIIQKYAKK